VGFVFASSIPDLKQRTGDRETPMGTDRKVCFL